jgi:hypothetical protein
LVRYRYILWKDRVERAGVGRLSHKENVVSIRSDHPPNNTNAPPAARSVAPPVATPMVMGDGRTVLGYQDYIVRRDVAGAWCAWERVTS